MYHFGYHLISEARKKMEGNGNNECTGTKRACRRFCGVSCVSRKNFRGITIRQCID